LTRAQAQCSSSTEDGSPGDWENGCYSQQPSIVGSDKLSVMLGSSAQFTASCFRALTYLREDAYRPIGLLRQCLQIRKDLLSILVLAHSRRFPAREEHLHHCHFPESQQSAGRTQTRWQRISIFNYLRTRVSSSSYSCSGCRRGSGRASISMTIPHRGVLRRRSWRRRRCDDWRQKCWIKEDGEVEDIDPAGPIRKDDRAFLRLDV